MGRCRQAVAGGRLLRVGTLRASSGGRGRGKGRVGRSGEMARTKGREVPPAGAGRWRLEWGRSGGGAWRGSCYRAWLRAAAWSSEREQGKGRRTGATQATVCIMGFVAFVGCQIARNRCSIGPMSQKRECMKICIKMCILINLFSQILDMPRHIWAYPSAATAHVTPM